MEKLIPAQPAFARIIADGLELRIKVVPGASRSAFAGELGDRLKVRIASAPERGKANAALLAFLAHWLGAKDLELSSGHTSPEKVVLVRGLTSLTQSQLRELAKKT